MCAKRIPYSHPSELGTFGPPGSAWKWPHCLASDAKKKKGNVHYKIMGLAAHRGHSEPRIPR